MDGNDDFMGRPALKQAVDLLKPISRHPNIEKPNCRPGRKGGVAKRWIPFGSLEGTDDFIGQPALRGNRNFEKRGHLKKGGI